MRKRIVVLSLAAALLLSSCGGSSSSAAASSVANESVASSVAESESASEAIVDEVVEEEPEPREGNFRVGFWGDDIETVKKYETATLKSEKEDYLLYDDVKVMSYPAYAQYYFDSNDALYQAIYLFTNSYNQGAHYITQYEEVKKALTSIYGEPVEDWQNVYNSAAKYTDEGKALEYGYIGYATIWETEDTRITQSLVNQNDIASGIIYEDINHEEVINTTGL